MRLRLGTRGSQLATTQSGTVADALRALGHEVELVIIRTRGDKERGSLTALAGLGVFAAELRTALLEGECDFAVHSFKDLPVAEVPGLVIAAVPEREAPADALCSRSGGLLELPAGARVGTGSPRRVAQLRALRPDLEYVDIRGNVGTRLARVAQGDLDAVVLAAAGLNRLGLGDRITELLPILPAPGQGALAVEARQGDDEVLAVLRQLEHAASRAAAEAERALLAALGGGCAAPIAGRAEVDGDELTLDGGVFSVDGGRQLTGQVQVPAGQALSAGVRLAADLMAGGAADITELGAERPSRLDEFHDDSKLWSPAGDGHDEPRAARPLEGLTVLVSREDGELIETLKDAGASVWGEPVLAREDLDVGIEALPDADWVAVTSAATLDSLRARGWELPSGARIAAVGGATAAALQAAGHVVDLQPGARSSAEELLAVWPEGTGSVLIPGSVRSRRVLAKGLEARGWQVRNVDLYDVVPREPTGSLRVAWQRGEVNAVLVTSGSVGLAVDEMLGWPDGIKVVAFGQPSADVLASIGIHAEVARTQDGRGVVEAFIRIQEENR